MQFGTRVLPLDSVARNTLRVISERTAVYIPDVNSKEPDAKILLPANQWFLDVAFRPELAERFPVFEVDHDEVLGLIGQQQKGKPALLLPRPGAAFCGYRKSRRSGGCKKQNEEQLQPF